MIILTTSYNCENYIEKSLLSIMSQRFKDFKCYITDDMSTDNTVNVIKKTIIINIFILSPWLVLAILNIVGINWNQFMIF